ncbi:MAG: HesA/MoeB/ThiF family protein [Methanomassiliicoccales archaeon]
MGASIDALVCGRAAVSTVKGLDDPARVVDMTELTDRDRVRYSRQILMDGIGEEGQERLSSSTVGVFGVGGLGSPAAMYLASAGVGRLILADPQVPDLSNLNRQVLHWERDVEGGTSKARSAAEKLGEMNRDIDIRACEVLVDGDNIAEVFGEADLVVDCLDDFTPRYSLNAFCLREGKPFVHAAVEGFSGQITTIVPGETPCLACVFPSPPPRKEVFPILGATAGVFGSLEAAEAVKLITGAGNTLASRLLIGDLLNQHWDFIEVFPADTCRVCGVE